MTTTDEQHCALDEQQFTLALDTLRSGAELPAEQTAALSHLDVGEVESFRQIWSSLTAERKQGLLATLVAAEQASLRQDFNAIYGLALLDSDAGVRQAAVGSIVEDVEARLLNRLIELARNDPAPAIRAAAVAHLAPYALRVELGEISDEWRVPLRDVLLESVQGADDLTLRREALASLGYLDSDVVAAEIRRAFADAELRLAAVRAMGRTANPGWLPLLRQESASDDDELREEIARAAGEMADQRGAKFVVNMLDDPALEVRLAAIKALGQIGGDEARDGLIYALEDKRSAVRQAAELALSELETYEDPLTL